MILSISVTPYTPLWKALPSHALVARGLKYPPPLYLDGSILLILLYPAQMSLFPPCEPDLRQHR